MTTRQVLGLPDQVRACLFDLDGVLTQTASVHAAAWKEMFDDFLRKRCGDTFQPFDAVADYDKYVDGRPRADGTRSFLLSRGIGLPEGSPADLPKLSTVNGLSNRKNELVLHRIDTDGVQAFPGSVRYVQAVRAGGLRTGVVSSSANCRQVLLAAGIGELFDVRIDALIASTEGLRGKPAPDTFLAAAHALRLRPDEGAVFEDSLAGVEAGRTGGFGFVVGVDRVGQADALRRHGADVVVIDLAMLLGRS